MYSATRFKCMVWNLECGRKGAIWAALAIASRKKANMLMRYTSRLSDSNTGTHPSSDPPPCFQGGVEPVVIPPGFPPAVVEHALSDNQTSRRTVEANEDRQ
eukprot:6936706-Pyramimonas_sp.AAC.1